MLFDSIRQHHELYGIVQSRCSENDVGITFADELLDHEGYPDESRVLILKLDLFYNSARMNNPPPSVDCMIIVKCEQPDHFNLYFVELRNTKRTRYVRPSEIIEKFRTSLFDFFEQRYASIFIQDNVTFQNIQLYLVTDPLRMVGKNLSEEEMRKIVGGTVLDAYGSIQPLRFQGRRLLIKPQLPNPTIACC
jgi:hypothetical protein